MTEQYKPKHFAILDYLNSQDTLKAFRSGSGGEFPDTPDSDTIEESNNQEKGKASFYPHQPRLQVGKEWIR